MLSLIHRIAGRPWAIRGEIAEHVMGVLRREGFAGLRALVELRADVHPERVEARRGKPNKRAGATALVSVIGTITQRGDVINSEETVSASELADTVTALAADAGVNAIVIEYDTGGGEVYGIPEAASAIRAAREVKPVVGVANSVSASAGYWLLAQSSEVMVSPSGEVGSLGVRILHMDESEALKAEGITVTHIADPPDKVLGNAQEPLSDRARDELQGIVTEWRERFEDEVAMGRRLNVATVREGFGQGRMVRAKAAKASGMVDRIGTLDDAVRRAGTLARERARNPAAFARAQVEAARARQRVGG